FSENFIPRFNGISSLLFKISVTAMVNLHRILSFLIPVWACGLIVQAKEIPVGFLETYCYDCHGDGIAKGGLSFDELPLNLEGETARQAMRKWARVLERIELGEMPPAKKRQPSEGERHKTVHDLAEFLESGERTWNHENGRRPLRFLTRSEFQNSIEDILLIKDPISQQIPFDPSSHGFDKIGEGRILSGSHLKQYMAIADRLADILLEKKKPILPKTSPQTSLLEDGYTKHSVLTAKRMFYQGQSVIYNIGAFVPPGTRTQTVRQDGRYNLRFHARSLRSQDLPSFAIYYGHFKPGFRGGNKGNFLTRVDIASKAATYEVTADLEKGEYFRFIPEGLHHWADPRKVKLEEYEGDGIVLEWYETDGPHGVGGYHPGYVKWFGEVPLNDLSTQQFLTSLLRLKEAFMRRSLSPEEREALESLVKASRSHEDIFRSAFSRMVCSPHFLYFLEDLGPLDSYQIASRLSYFLWNSVPDSELLDLAKSGKLREQPILRKQVERLFADPRSSRFIEDFTGQWLKLKEINFTQPDVALYADFDNALRDAMVGESRLYFKEVLERNLSVSEFLDSDFTYANERLAAHYGLPKVKGSQLRRVSLPAESVRGGVMTQASVLKVSADGSNTSPVLRGVWILENILGVEPPPPPAGVPAIEPDIRGATTILEKLEKHRDDPKCAGCHAKIDPPGIVLENFDVIGGWRDNYRSTAFGQHVENYVFGKRVRYRDGLEVVSSTRMADGTNIEDVRSFKNYYMARPEVMARAITRKLLTYATAHGLEFGDRKAVTQILKATEPSDYSLKDIIKEVVCSQLFLNK
ncbi:MAG: DUF1592 domain-containing protein, partial [Opitutales bacterium]